MDILFIRAKLPKSKEGLRLKDWVVSTECGNDSGAEAALRGLSLERFGASLQGCKVPVIRPVVLDWSEEDSSA